MTREEQAKKDCAIIISDDMEFGIPYSAGYNKGIEVGVKWADEHPSWTLIADELLPKDERVLAQLPNGNVTIVHRLVNNEIYSVELGMSIHPKNIIAWIPLPKPLKTQNT